MRGERNMNELQHYGVKGMKWGVRKKREYTPLEAKRAAYKQAKKDYSKAYNKAFAGYSPIKKHRQANDQRWEDAANKAEALRKAKSDYKSAKKTARIERKAEKKAVKEDYKKIKKVAGQYDVDYNERGEITSIRDKRMEAYVTMAKEKGQAHTNRVIEMEKNKKLTELAVTTVGTGMFIVGYMLSSN